MELKKESQKEKVSPEMSDVITGINNEKCCSEPLKHPFTGTTCPFRTANTTKDHFTQE